MSLRGSSLREKLRINVRPDGDCLRWTGYVAPNGYGRVRSQGAAEEAHRVAYELFVGPIPEGYEIDHVYRRGCRFTDCVKPEHLEAVTPQENTRRRIDAITHCPHGHEYTDANSQWESNGKRVTRRCRTCRSRVGGKRVILAVAA